MKLIGRIALAGLISALTFILSACSTDDENYMYEPDTIGCRLAAALMNHEAVLELEEVFITLPEPGLTIAYRIRYESEGYEVIGYAVAPVDFMDNKYPILIVNRGGNREFGMWLSPNDFAGIAEAGFIMLASQYRGVAGGTGVEQFGGDDINDVLRLIDISESFDFAQQGGVYMFGGSRGGMMTYIASRLDERIVAAAVWAARSDLISTWEDERSGMRLIFTELIGGPPEGELLEEYIRRSAIFWADEIKPPILIMHGGDTDWRVLTQHSINMAEALERYGRPHRLVIFSDAGHDMPETAYFEAIQWFSQHPISP